MLLLSETGSTPLPYSTVLLVTVLRRVGNKAKDTEEAEKIFLHPIPIWKTHMTSSNYNEEWIALLDLIPSGSGLGKKKHLGIY